MINVKRDSMMQLTCSSTVKEARSPLGFDLIQSTSKMCIMSTNTNKTISYSPFYQNK